MKGWILVLLMGVCGLIHGGCSSYCDDYPNDSRCRPVALGVGPSGFPTRSPGSSPTGVPTSGGPTNTQLDALGCDGPPRTSVVNLGISYTQQECDEVCWAATIGMVSQFFGRPLQQCQLASMKVQLTTGASYDCCYAGACGDPYCDQPAVPQVMENVMSQGLDIHGLEVDRPLTEDELLIELSNNRPVIVGYVGPFAGHVAVINGFIWGSPTVYFVYDPWPSFGNIQIPYSAILQGPPGQPWRMSFAHLSQGNDPCQGRPSR